MKRCSFSAEKSLMLVSHLRQGSSFSRWLDISWSNEAKAGVRF